MKARADNEPRRYLASSMFTTEQRHRRYVLLGVGSLLLLALSPVFGHHLSSRLDQVLAGQDHVWGICLTALHILLAPVHGSFHVLLALGLGFALIDRIRAWTRLRSALSLLSTEQAAYFSELSDAASEAGVDAARIRVVDSLPTPAFTAGFWRPHIYLSKDVLHLLSPGQLVALLAHEGVHVSRRDPLRLSLLRFLACSLFWIPAFRRLSDDVADEAEIAADNAAATHDPLVLASTILLLADWARGKARMQNGFPLASSAMVGVVDSNGSNRKALDLLLERRVRRLAGETSTVASHLSRRSIAFAGVVLMLAWTSGLAVAHPMPTSSLSSSSHCLHEHSSALTHLFCLRDSVFASGGASNATRQCPHAGMGQS